MLIDPSTLATTERTPLDELIAAEEQEDHDTLDLAGLRGIPADALAVLLRFLLPDGRPTSPTYWQQASRRLASLAHAIGVQEIRMHPLASLAPALGCSRALLSLLAVELRDFADLDHRAGRSDEARQVYATRARAIWNSRGRKAQAKIKESP